MNAKWRILALLLVSTAVVAQDGDQPSASPADQSLIRVTTKRLSDVLSQPVIRVSAEVISLNHAQISAQATGEVLGIEVEVGDQVDKGEALVSLDCRQSKLNQAAARDSLKLARQEFKRAQSLGKTRAIAEQQLNQAQSTLDQARIQLKQTEIATENCVIKAPFSGVVTKRQIQLGAISNPGLPVLELLQTDAVEVEVQVSPAQLKSLQRAEGIEFVTQDARYAVAIRAALPMVNSSNNKRSLRMNFSNQTPYAGSAGELVWQLATQVIPVDYVVQRDAQLGYFIVEDKVARFVSLVNAQMGYPATVAGLSSKHAETRLIVEGRFRVEDGSSIKIIP